MASLAVRDRSEYATEAAARASLPEALADLPYRGVWRQGSPQEAPVHVFTDDDTDLASIGWIEET